MITACNYASEGDTDGLRKLRAALNVDFNIGDYDRRTPLHVAVANKKY